MFDTRPALADMADQIRSCRASDGLTLQQLASRSGVAASTIHKVETQQMVPTVSVLMKIARGLGRRPEELVRDEIEISERANSNPRTALRDVRGECPDDSPRAIVMVERGNVCLQTGEQRIEMKPGDCIAVEGGRIIETLRDHGNDAGVTLVVSPPGTLESDGPPGATRPETGEERLSSIPDHSHGRPSHDLNTDLR